MKIKKVDKNKGNKFGARKYAEVDSDTYFGVKYTVVKVRVKNTKNYAYKCTCPDHIYRNRECKHIREFKLKEK